MTMPPIIPDKPDDQKNKVYSSEVLFIGVVSIIVFITVFYFKYR